MNDYTSMTWFPFEKLWVRVPEYQDASLAARAIVDGAMRVYMDRGSLPSSPEGLRRSIGADEREFARGFDEAQLAIRILEPRWSEALAEAWKRFDRVRERNRTIARTRKRPAAHETSTTSATVWSASGAPDGSPSDAPLVDQLDAIEKETLKGLAEANHPGTSRRKSSACSEPEGFDDFWRSFRDRYPERPGQPWTAGRKAMLNALQRHPGLNLDNVLEAVSEYREMMVAMGKVGTDKVCHVSTWLNQDRWEADYFIAPTGGENYEPLF